MYDLKIIKGINWRKVRDGCERDSRPMHTATEDPPVLISELPEIPVAWVDHLVWEVVHVTRLTKTTTVNKLPEGAWTVVPGQPYSEYLTLLMWEVRSEDNDHDPQYCRACRLVCRCGCGGDKHGTQAG